MLKKSRIRSAVLIVGLLPLFGCFTYTEGSLLSLTPGLQARLELDSDGFGRLVNQAATNGVPLETLDMDDRRVVGRVLELNATDLVFELRGGGGAVFPTAVPRSAVQQVGLRSLDKKRTLLAIAAGAIVGGFVLSGTAGGSTGPPGEGDIEMMFPRFSISVP